ncbi:MAG: efflux RND transporter periplasmic adaptor subunit [Flavobacteriales bacterium]|jgi:multidrug efflux pump subunit AcrA (membrane-fusion protein)|nr:efflux RND transporter periplasmic adaptor subunit [Flavobacteriales bacterium]MCB0758029.1 efflux RND transporter periplasmic adaptor subunit [Flavobacteriales bacterium]
MGTRIWTVLGFLFLGTACGQKGNPITPATGPITESVYANGLVKAEGQYQVFPTVSGTVLALLVKEGDTVRAGQPLLRIDDRTSSLSTSSAEAQLRLLEQNVREEGPVLTRLRAAVDQARDRLNLDSTNFKRQEALWAQGIGSRNELDQRQLAYTTSKAAYAMATKALTENREQLRTQLEVARNTAAISAVGDADRAPGSLIDGIVYDLMIEPGELATPQRPVAVIGSASDLYLELEVDEFDIRLIKPGLQVFVSLDSYGDQAFEAQVSRIIPLMNERSRTFKVEARFTKRPPQLYPNLTVEASIVLRTKENALLVPASYIVDGTYVLTGTDEKTLVKLGARDMEKVEVLDGITANTTLYKP